MIRHVRGWGPAAPEIPQQHHLVRPRHLAGGGDLTHITTFLAAAGWKYRTPKAGTPTCFENHERVVRIGYSPHTSPPMWIISGTPPGRPAWHATIGAAAPVEILAGFTDALARPRPAHAPDVLGTLTARGWKPGKGEHPAAIHPDGSALMQYRHEGEHAVWWAAAHTPSSQGHAMPLWHAAFSEHVPLHAVEGFAAALADPRPVLRPPGRIPFASAAQVSLTAYPVLPSQYATWQHARAAAGHAAAWARSARAVAPTRPRRRSRPAATPPRPAFRPAPTRSR